ncbi:MAG: GNAT family N-acetyltransferase [Paracoccaceae bacterium]
MTYLNNLGQHVGQTLPDWEPCPLPPRATIEGAYVRLEPQTVAAHLDDLWEAFSAEPTGADWTHRLIGPFATRDELKAWMLGAEHDATQMFFTYVDKATGKASGNGAFMSMQPAAGSIEAGSIMFSPALQRTRAATEAIFLHIDWAFANGYRRFEWTCDPLNAASMGAAERFGFSFEALFRQAYVAKGRNRDKACFSVLDTEWPSLRAVFQTWLAPNNFDAAGVQKQSLRTLSRPLVNARTDASDRGLRNTLGQPVDQPVDNWTPRPRPTRQILTGQYCRLEPLALEHAPALHAAHCHDEDGRNWTYLPEGPFASAADYAGWVSTAAVSPDPLHYTIVTERGPVGTASLMRMAPAAGSIEVGYITFSPLLQRTRASTEAMYLMMKWAFDAGYRRYEWKCNALNVPSRQAAQRLGFSFEGVFRQAVVTRSANRDTAWYGIIDSEWPAIREAMETWLDPQNFDPAGQQKQSLSDLTRPILVAEDPTLS